MVRTFVSAKSGDIDPEPMDDRCRRYVVMLIHARLDDKWSIGDLFTRRRTCSEIHGGSSCFVWHMPIAFVHRKQKWRRHLRRRHAGESEIGGGETRVI